jgi:hypothetical protein
MATCQLLGRWQPDSAVRVDGLTGFMPVKDTSLGFHNLRSSPGWTALIDSNKVWHFAADTACRNPSIYTF